MKKTKEDLQFIQELKNNGDYELLVAAIEHCQRVKMGIDSDNTDTDTQMPEYQSPSWDGEV